MTRAERGCPHPQRPARATAKNFQRASSKPPAAGEDIRAPDGGRGPVPETVSCAPIGQGFYCRRSRCLPIYFPLVVSQSGTSSAGLRLK
jgi:hypothetical protein